MANEGSREKEEKLQRIKPFCSFSRNTQSESSRAQLKLELKPELDKRPTWQMIRFVFLSVITGSSQQYITPFKNHPAILKSPDSPSRWTIPLASEQTVPIPLDSVSNRRSQLEIAAHRKCNKGRETERICIDESEIQLHYRVKASQPRWLSSTTVASWTPFLFANVKVNDLAAK